MFSLRLPVLFVGGPAAGSRSHGETSRLSAQATWTWWFAPSQTASSALQSPWHAAGRAPPLHPRPTGTEPQAVAVGPQLGHASMVAERRIAVAVTIGARVVHVQDL